MKDIKNLNIWKTEEETNKRQEGFLGADITELQLNVRPFNCLKRAGCHKIGDVLKLLREDGQGLRKIRNLGSRSEQEILEKIQDYKESCLKQGINCERTTGVKRTVIKPAKKMWDRTIDEFHLSNYALSRLRSSGIQKIGDLYATNPKQEPGWYAVRALFEKIPSGR